VEPSQEFLTLDVKRLFLPFEQGHKRENDVRAHVEVKRLIKLLDDLQHKPRTRTKALGATWILFFWQSQVLLEQLLLERGLVDIEEHFVQLDYEGHGHEDDEDLIGLLLDREHDHSDNLGANINEERQKRDEERLHNRLKALLILLHVLHLLDIFGHFLMVDKMEKERAE